MESVCLLETQILVAHVRELIMHHQGSGDQTDGHRELEHNEAAAQPPRWR